MSTYKVIAECEGCYKEKEIYSVGEPSLCKKCYNKGEKKNGLTSK